MVLLLTGLLASLALSVVVRQRSTQESLAARLELAMTVRTTRHVLRDEVRRTWPSRDLGPIGPDSLPLRAFRGLGLPCGEAVAPQVLVAARGLRRPDPEKDSLLVLVASGSWWVSGLERAAAASGRACAHEGGVQHWTLTDSFPEPILLLRYFERGTYHLAAGAFRYRRGGGGRQPLTSVNLATPPSGFFVVGDRMAAELVSVPPLGTWRVATGGRVWP